MANDIWSRTVDSIFGRLTYFASDGFTLSFVESGPTWTSSDGVITPVRNMTNGHLINTIAMLERRWRSLEDQRISYLKIEDIYPMHPILVAEARCRQLIKLPTQILEEDLVTDPLFNSDRQITRNYLTR